MDAGAYLIGCALLLAAAAALAYGAWAARRGLLPEATGAAARLAEIVIALATVVVVGELLGAIGIFNRPALAVALIAAAAGLTALGHHTPVEAPVKGRNRTLVDASPRLEVWAATVAVAVVGAQWAGKIGFALDKGMTHPDTVWYHAPYAAAFVQRGHLLDQLDATDPLHAYAGQTSELLHATLLLLLGRDVLSPLVNVGWAALALLAAWCLGRRYGAGALCVLGATVVLGLPMIEATHPGQASNDLAAGALLLAAIALLVESNLATVPVALAGLSAGLALGTKVTVAAPVAVLTIGVLFLAWRRRHFVVAIGWCVAVALTGSFWFVRNVIVAHNPVPYYSFHLGPFTLSAVPQRHPDAVARYLFDGEVWRAVFRPGFAVALGRAWPVVLLLGAGALFTLLPRQPALRRVAGLAAFAGLVAYVFTPYTADLFAFKFNVRYATPALLAAVTLFALAISDRASWWRRVATVVFVALVVIDATASNHERVPAWPERARVLGPLAALAIVGGAVAWYLMSRRGGTGRHAWWIVAGAVAVALVAGWPIQRHALDHRYLDAGLPLDVVDAALQRVHDTRIAYFGTSESYPFYGTDLSNRVTRPSGPPPGAAGDACREVGDDPAPLRVRRGRAPAVRVRGPARSHARGRSERDEARGERRRKRLPAHRSALRQHLLILVPAPRTETTSALTATTASTTSDGSAAARKRVLAYVTSTVTSTTAGAASRGKTGTRGFRSEAARPAQDDRAGDGEELDDVQPVQRGPRNPTFAAFDEGIDRDALARLVEPDDAQQPHTLDLRDLSEVVADIVERGAPVREIHLRLVVAVGDACAPVGLDRASDVEVAAERAVVGRVAVRGRQQRADLRAEEHRVLEAGRVVARPGRDHDRRGEDRAAEHLPPVGDRPRPRRERQRHDHEGHQQQELRARERGEAADRTHCREPPPARPAPEPVREPHREGREEHRERLGLEHAVGRPHVRVHRDDRSRAQTDARSSDLPPDQPRDDHRRGAEHTRPEQVREHALHAEHRRDREVHEVQRRVLGRGHAAGREEERRDETLAVGEQVRARVVEERVAARLEVAALDQHVRDPHARARRARSHASAHANPRPAVLHAELGGPTKTAVGIPNSSMRAINARVSAGTSGASPSMNRFSSTCATRPSRPARCSCAMTWARSALELGALGIGARIEVRDLGRPARSPRRSARSPPGRSRDAPRAGPARGR